MRKTLGCCVAALSFTSTLQAAVTGSVYLVLKNASQQGTFSGSSLYTLADCTDYNAYDRSVYAPGADAAPGSTFMATFSGLYVWSGVQGRYTFSVSFWDTDSLNQKRFYLNSNVTFPGTGTWYVSKAGVTAFNPGAVNAFDVTNSAPPAATVNTVIAGTADPAHSLQVTWTLPSSTAYGDFQSLEVQRALGNSSTWTPIRSYSYWGATTFTDTGLEPSTAYSYRLATYDDYGAVTYSSRLSGITGSVPEPVLMTTVAMIGCMLGRRCRKGA